MINIRTSYYWCNINSNHIQLTQQTIFHDRKLWRYFINILYANCECGKPDRTCSMNKSRTFKSNINKIPFQGIIFCFIINYIRCQIAFDQMKHLNYLIFCIEFWTNESVVMLVFLFWFLSFIFPAKPIYQQVRKLFYPIEFPKMLIFVFFSFWIKKSAKIVRFFFVSTLLQH